MTGLVSSWDIALIPFSFHEFLQVINTIESTAVLFLSNRLVRLEMAKL